MIKDLGITNSEYNTSLALYFIAYVLFEVPANVSYFRTWVVFLPSCACALTSLSDRSRAHSAYPMDNNTLSTLEQLKTL